SALTNKSSAFYILATALTNLAVAFYILASALTLLPLALTLLAIALTLLPSALILVPSALSIKNKKSCFKWSCIKKSLFFFLASLSEAVFFLISKKKRLKLISLFLV